MLNILRQAALPGRRPARALVVATVLAVALAAPPARSAIVDIPPLTITQLEHGTFGFWVRDVIFIPGTGYSGAGFAATYGAGDIVRVRVQAPPGKKFRVRAPVPPTTGNFNVNIYWPCTGGTISNFSPYTVTFENFTGTPPSTTYTLVVANELIIETWLDYVTHGVFEFTALRVDIVVDQGLPRARRVFGDVLSYASPSVGAAMTTSDMSAKAMEIIDAGIVPASTGSWGRLKALYR